MKTSDMLIVALVGGVAVYFWRKSQPAAGYAPGDMVSVRDPATTTATVRSTTAAPAQSRATVAVTSSPPYAPMINAPAYAPEGWAPPSF